MMVRGRTFATTAILAIIVATQVPITSQAHAVDSSGRVDPDLYTCDYPGFIDFEGFPDATDLSQETFDGIQFTTTDGYTWQVLDFASGNYNGKYPNGAYTARGSKSAWLGPDQGRGRIDFTAGRASFVSLLVSTDTPVWLEAYGRDDVLLETAGPSSSNTNTGLMDELAIIRPRSEIAYVVVHDSGNYFTIDAVCTDARKITSRPPPIQWADLGDSFSAGVGLGKVTDGCDRDDGAQAPLAVSQLNRLGTVTVDRLTRVACSGATTADYWSSQAEMIRRTDDIVSMTLGGNDTQIAAKIKMCWLGDCGPDIVNVTPGWTSLNNPDDLTWDELFSRLVDVYFDARMRMDPDGYLLVQSYPMPFALGSGSKCNGIPYDHQLAANAFITRMGDTIYQAVQAANDQLRQAGRAGNVEFVDWRTGPRVEGLYEVPAGYPSAGETFAVHVSPNGLCARGGDKSFLNDFVKRAPTNPDRNNSFHPNKWGYGHAGELLRARVQELFL